MIKADKSAGLILASASGQRLALLRRIGIEPVRVAPVAIDESPLVGELPRAMASRLAEAKLEAALLLADAGHYVLAADTVVACGRRALGKPLDAEQAELYLRLLSGRAHMVWTSVAVAAPDGRVGRRSVRARVRFKRLTERDIAGHMRSEQWRGRAGGYSIQGLASRFVLSLSGSYTAIVGLPLYEAYGLLTGLGMSKAGEPEC